MFTNLYIVKILSLPYILLRYFLGGDRPSQTTIDTMVFAKLVVKILKSGISNAFKQFTYMKIYSSKFKKQLPPILHIKNF
jgi:hypothetical protein